MEAMQWLVIYDHGQGSDPDKVINRVLCYIRYFMEPEDSKGLDLQLVYTPVTAMDGEIDIQSKVNKETTFVITFKKEDYSQ